MPAFPSPLALDDGSPHTISTSIGTAYVSGGTSVSVVGGGECIGPDAMAVEYWLPATKGMFAQDSSVTLSGGKLIGGNAISYLSGSDVGLEQWGGNFASSSGWVIAGTDNLNGRPGAIVSRPTSCSISGGGFHGGDCPVGSGGTGLVLSLDGSTSGTISGGIFSGGNGSTGPGTSLAFIGFDSSSLSISGGVYSGPIAISLQSSSTISFSGTGLAYSGGMLTGTLSDGHVLSATIIDLNASPLTVTGSTSHLTFSP